jgi:hypothetical protein
MKQKLLLTGYLCAMLSCAKAQTPHFQWAKNMGGVSSCEGFSIASDASGNTYTTGHFLGTADFDPSVSTFNMTVAGAGGSDVFISKLDASGNFVWAKQLGSTMSDCGNAIAVDKKGNVYTTGYFAGTVDFDPGAGTYNLTATGSSNMFISKLDSAGNFIWAKSIVGAGTCIGNAIAVDTLGNVYTTGPFTSTIDFDPGTATLNMTATGAKDVFISKLDTAGNLVWAKQIGGDGITVPNAIAVDNSGNVYTTGFFYSTVDFDPGAGVSNLTAVGYNDIFVSKLDNAGNYVWAKQFGGSSYELGFGIAVDQSNNIYTTGYFYNTVDFDPNAGTYNMTNTGTYDMFISKLDAVGNFIWAKQFGGTLYAEGHSIKTDASGNVYTTGLFQGSIDFDPSSSAYNLVSVGSYDIFISKLDPAGNFVWAKGMGGAAEDYGHCITVDPSENVYTTGSFLRTVDFDPDAGVYNLTPTGSSSDIFVHKISQNTTGIMSPPGVAMGNIYPNPTDGIIQIETSAASNNDIEIQVFNSLGKMLINEHVKNSGLVSLNLNQYNSGLYFIKVMSNNEVLIQKSIVKH